MKTNTKRYLALLLSVVLLLGGTVPVFAQAGEAQAERAYTLEAVSNPVLDCTVLIVTFGSEYVRIGADAPEIRVTYPTPQAQYPSTLTYVRQIFAQDGETYAQLFIRWPTGLPWDAWLDVPAGMFRTAADEGSDAAQFRCSAFDGIELSMNLYAQKLTYENHIVADRSLLTPDLLCDGVCTAAYQQAVQYYAAYDPRTTDLSQPLTVPFKPDRSFLWPNGNGSFPICAYINELLFFPGYVHIISPAKAYAVGVKNALLDSVRIPLCFLGAIPAIFIVAWPGVWLAPLLLSDGMLHVYYFFSNLFSIQLRNEGKLQMNNDSFYLQMYKDGWNGGGWLNV